MNYAILGGLGVVIDVCIWVFFVSGCYVVLGFVLFGWVWIFEVFFCGFGLIACGGCAWLALLRFVGSVTAVLLWSCCLVFMLVFDCLFWIGLL